MTEKKPLIKWPWIVGVAAFPLVMLGLFVLLAVILGQRGLRYDPQYFTPEYQAMYEVPGAVAYPLETALRTGDEALMAELQGLRRTRDFVSGQNIRLGIMYEMNAGYLSYLFWDTVSFERYPYHVQLVEGRWVVAPEDVVYYFKSGKWRVTWGPLAMIWWWVSFIVIMTLLIYRASGRWRAESLEPGGPQQE